MTGATNRQGLVGKRAHQPVLFAECLSALAIKGDGVYVDATFGRGGHSVGILSALGQTGRLIAIDRDLDAVAVAEQLAVNDHRLTAAHASFADLERTLARLGVTAVDGILFDLGVSSPQLDEAARGFGFRQDAPLDMRMDRTQTETAESWLNSADERTIAEVLRSYGDERFAVRIAKKVVAVRREQRITRTGVFADIVRACVPTREAGQDPATRSFQAVRIRVNGELDALSLSLPQCCRLLKTGGRLAVIAFHSLEDRIVKQFLRAEMHPDPWPKDLPLRSDELPLPRMAVVGRAIRPTASEVSDNPRARSAVLRVGERLAVDYSTGERRAL